MEKLIIIRQKSDLSRLLSVVEENEYLAYDTETVSTDYNTQIIGFSVAADTETGYYVILAAWDPVSKTLQDTGLKEACTPIIAKLATKKLVMQNGGFDCEKTLYNFGIDLMPALHTDTMILAQLLDENRPVGLKELAVAIFGEDSAKEQAEMKASVSANGGQLTKACYELYKADPELIAKYGAKDAILTMKVFYHLVPELFEQGLDKFFYDEESMPLVRGPTYDLNTTGLRVDAEKLQNLKAQLQLDIADAKAYIRAETEKAVAERFPGTSKASVFNIGSNQQLSWLLYGKLGNEFHKLTDGGRDLCRGLGIKVPYAPSDKRTFLKACTENLGQEYTVPGCPKPKKVREPWAYIECGQEALAKLAPRYKWVAKLLELKKNEKLLSTYVEGIQDRMQYGIIRPSFLQHVTTSGRYSSRNPNFTNLPAGDKRIKAVIVPRPGRKFVGADWEQIEPRKFASLSQDARLLACFRSGDDFYSVVGAPTFGKTDCTLKKDGSPNSFAIKYKKLRDVAKVIALAIPYGTSASQLQSEIEKRVKIKFTLDECQKMIDDYLKAYPQVHKMMLDAYESVKSTGVVATIFGRKRRLSKALEIRGIYGNTRHRDLPADVRTVLNQAVNFPIQGGAASILNRTMIAFNLRVRALGLTECKIVLCVHDEIVVECRSEDVELVCRELKYCMENTVRLPGVELVANPIVADNLADLK